MKSKTVLITGNQGFVGTWVCLYFIRKSWSVVGIDNRSSIGARLFDEIELNSKLTHQYSFDICETNQLLDALRKHEPDLVINLAGQAIVPRAFREPFETFKTNALGTLSVLEAIRIYDRKISVSCITSDKVYQNNEQVWPYRENDTLGGKDVYSISKASAELISNAYSKSHLDSNKVNVQSIRLGNVVGGGDWSKDRLIPDMMNSLRNGGGKFYIRYPNATRPFQHVLDVAAGIYNISIAAISSEVESGNAWNLGPKNNTFAKVQSVIDMTSKIWNQLSFEENPVKNKEDINLSVEVAKYKSSFGDPKFTSAEALVQTFKWYEGYFKNKKINELIDEDFSVFEASND